ncbi:MAG: amidohydrolase family protein, partial [Aquabacterium sp.]
RHRHMTRRRMLGCCGAAAAAMFSSLVTAAPQGPAPLPPPLADMAAQALDGLAPAALWDCHAHLLGVGDAGSGCRIHDNMTRGFNLIERLRKRFILDAAGVDGDAPSVDQAYVQRMLDLARAFPAGARWMLFAFDDALDDNGRVRPDWTTFHVPDRYAAAVAAARPDRFAWVASVHPYREDALARLADAVANGAQAMKWLPSAMNIDLRDPRAGAFCDRLAALRMPLIVHCGEEKAVPGAGQDELVNPLLVRHALERGTRVIVAHCASLGQALDLDQTRPEKRPACELVARLMDEPRWQGQLLADVSGVFQSNRDAATWHTVLARTDWHPRLLHGSDYPLPGLGLLFRLGTLVRAEVLAEADVEPLSQLRRHNPLLFDLVLRRRLRHRGQGFARSVFDTRRHFRG